MRLEGSVNRRQFLGGLAVTAGSASVLAAGGSAGTSSKGWTSVSFSSIGTAQEQMIFKQAIAAAQEHSLNKLKIKLNWHPAPGTTWDKVMTQFASNTAYDVQRIDDDRVYTLALENKIHQLDKWLLDKNVGLAPNDYFPRFWTSIAVEGYQFGMLPAGSADVLYYNADLFHKAGVKAPTSWADAWSWDTFTHHVRALSKISGSKTQVYGVGFPFNVITPVGYGAGDTALSPDQTSCGFNKPGTIKALDALQQLIKGGMAPTPDLDTTGLFNSGRLAMLWNSMDFVATIGSTIKWGIMPWPKSPLFAMTENYDRAFVIPKSAKDPEAAYLALRALCEKPASDIWAKTRWAVPNLKASANGPLFKKGKPAHQNVWTETFGLLNGHPVDVPTPRGPIGEVWKSSFTEAPLPSAFFNGQTSARQFVDQVRKRVNDEIQSQHWNSSEGRNRLEQSGALTDPDMQVLKKYPDLVKESAGQGQ